MNTLSDALSITASGLQAQSERLRHVAENIANVETPGYHRKLTTFADAARDAPAGAVATGPVVLDQSPVDRLYDPGHPLADGQGYVDGSNVDLMIEVADAREASRSYEANLKMFEQIRQMSTALMDLLKR